MKEREEKLTVRGTVFQQVTEGYVFETIKNGTVELSWVNNELLALLDMGIDQFRKLAFDMEKNLKFLEAIVSQKEKEGLADREVAMKYMKILNSGKLLRHEPDEKSLELLKAKARKDRALTEGRVDKPDLVRLMN